MTPALTLDSWHAAFRRGLDRLAHDRFWIKGLLLALVIAGSLRMFSHEAMLTIDVQSTDHPTSCGCRLGLVLKHPPAVVTRGHYIGFHTDGRVAHWFKPGSLFVKRAIGLPGDRVQFIDGRIWVAGQEVGELNTRVMQIYARGGGHSYVLNHPDFVVSPGHYFVMSEADHSFDSRYWGLVDQASIVGNAYVIF